MTPTAQPLFDLTGKTVLVSGSTSGLGLPLAHALGTAGARLMLSGGDANALELAVAELHSAGIDARWVASDSTQSAGIEHMVVETLHRMGDIDILVNCAPLICTQAMHLDLSCHLMLSQGVVQQSMMARRRGCIIHVSPLAGLGHKPPTWLSVLHQTAHGALAHLTRAQAAQWRPHCITVNSICPNQWLSGCMPDAGGGLLPDSPPVLRSAVVQIGSANDRDDLDGPDDLDSLDEYGDLDGLRGACLLFASEAGRTLSGQCLTVSTAQRLGASCL